MRYLLALTALLCVPMAASGEIIVCIESIKLPASPDDQPFALEVFVESDEGTAPELIAHQLHFLISPAGAGVEFNDEGDPAEWTPIKPEHPYVFLPQRPIGQIDLGGASAYGGDILFQGSQDLDHNDGLLRLPLLLAGGTPAGSLFDVILDPDPQKSFLERDNVLAPIEFTIRNGTVTVTPEPEMLTLLAVFAVGLLLWARSKRALHYLCAAPQNLIHVL